MSKRMKEHRAVEIILNIIIVIFAVTGTFLMLTAGSDEERVNIYKDLQRNLADNAANIYIQDMVEFVALSDRFEGYVFYPLYVQDLAKIRLKYQ